MADLLWFFAMATCVKLLLSPTYHSTDFDVHRHWLSLTSSLPLSQWYSEESSQWTLDYPPLFAYFELLLSLFVDPISPIFPLLHRLSVAASDLTLLLGTHFLTRRQAGPARIMIPSLILFSPALLIVDHVHFQYNGYLLGILMISLGFLREGWDLAGGIGFAVLICSKHLYVVAGPVYFVYLLRHYCGGGGFWKGVKRFLSMGAAVGAVFAAVFGPFLYDGQTSPLVWENSEDVNWLFSIVIQQVLCRLFPFGRGLCHAYWAPNFWVFYIVLDKVLAFVLAKLGFNIQMPKASFTGGLVGDSSPFAVLPQVTPIITFLLVLLSMAPCIVKAFLKPRPTSVIRWVSYAYTCGFMFGWHVHEKASLHFTIPLGIIAMNSLEDARHYFLLSIVSCYSMFPLLFEPQEYPIKVLLLAIHSTLMWAGFSSYFSRRIVSESTKGSISKGSNEENRLIGWVGICYLLGLVCIEVWGQFLHPYIFGSRLPFFPLMLVSVYCASGMMYSWVWQLRQIIECT